MMTLYIKTVETTSIIVDHPKQPKKNRVLKNRDPELGPKRLVTKREVIDMGWLALLEREGGEERRMRSEYCLDKTFFF